MAKERVEHATQVHVLQSALQRLVDRDRARSRAQIGILPSTSQVHSRYSVSQAHDVQLDHLRTAVRNQSSQLKRAVGRFREVLASDRDHVSVAGLSLHDSVFAKFARQFEGLSDEINQMNVEDAS